MAHCKARESLDLIQMVSASVGAASIILILSTYWMFRKVLRSSLITLFNWKLVVMLVYSTSVLAASIQSVQDNFYTSKIVVICLYPSFIVLSAIEVAIIGEFMFSVSAGIRSRRNLAREKQKGRLYAGLAVVTIALVLFELLYEMKVYPGGNYWTEYADGHSHSGSVGDHDSHHGTNDQDTRHRRVTLDAMLGGDLAVNGTSKGSGADDDYDDTHINGFLPYVRHSYTYTSSAVFCVVLLLSIVNIVKTQQYLKVAFLLHSN
mmetsp:Transcript_32641/g.86153  ORF Transcript_32641/g.86153 Transcript_32641/m.86153 type:complete len:262 (-) Transcript_32641:155-940(-)